MSFVRVALVMCVLVFAPAVRAEPKASVTIEPIYLAITMVDATVEVRPTPHLGVAAIGGIGFPVFGTTFYDLGAQANVYPSRAFSGWHFGTELRYLWGSTHYSWLGVPDSPDATERLVGVYLGWKWVTRYGLTAILQYGVGRMNTSGGAMDANVPRSQIIPVANLTAGWSF